jgi:hypothetical protein
MPVTAGIASAFCRKAESDSAKKSRLINDLGQIQAPNR